LSSLKVKRLTAPKLSLPLFSEQWEFADSCSGKQQYGDRSCFTLWNITVPRKNQSWRRKVERRRCLTVSAA